MAQLTERENLLKVYAGEVPEWVPINEHSVVQAFGPPFLTSWYKRKGRPEDPQWHLRAEFESGDRLVDLYDIEYEVSDPRIGLMPAPDVIKMPDLAKWRDTFPPFPNLDVYDWEALAKAGTANWDRKNRVTKFLCSGCSAGSTYMWMATLLGHKDALTSMLEEPEAWHEVQDQMASFQEKLVKYVAKYYKPDSIAMADDCAYGHGTFMSPKTYREMIKPYHARIIKAIINEGCVPEIHCCGKADAIADDFAEIGIRSWNPAQHFNDLEGVKARNGNKLIIDGGWESNGPAGINGASEEVVRGAVRRAMDRCAPGGGYVFSTSGMTSAFDVGQQHMDWIYDEAVKYGRAFYKK